MKLITAFIAAAAVSLLLMVLSVVTLSQVCSSPGFGPSGGNVPIRMDFESGAGQAQRISLTDRGPERIQFAQAGYTGWGTAFVCSIKATDVAIAGFALFLVLTLVLQNLFQATWIRRVLHASERSALVVDEAFVSTQRPYVFMREFRVNVVKNPLNEEIQICTVQPVWENTGTTPTRSGRAHVNWKFFDRSIPSDFDFPDYDESGNRILSYDTYKPLVVGPRSSALSPLIDIDPSILRQVRDQQGKLLIWGWTEYDEVFTDSRRHRTEFCYQLVVTGSPPSWVGFSQHRVFNGVDEDCMKEPTALVRAG